MRALILVLGLVAILSLVTAQAAPPVRPAPGEVIDQVAQYTGLTNDAVSLALKDNATALGRLTDAVLAVQIAQRFLDARDAEIASDVLASATDTAAEALLPPPLMTAIKAMRVYKSLLEAARGKILNPALDRQLYEAYRYQRQDQDPINAFSYAVSQSLGAGGYFASKPRMVEEYITNYKDWNPDLVGEPMRRRVERQVDRFWMARLEATYQQEKAKPQKEAMVAAIWASVKDILDQFKAPAGLSAELFPDPGKDLPAGWWWARSAGAEYKPPAAMQSYTPMWTQTIELSTAQGYVFKPYRGGGGSWCRPAANGKCDLPYQRISIDISDWTMHGGETACAQSLQGEVAQWPDIYKRLSERAATYTRHNPEQNGIRFCLKNFSISLNDTALNGPAPDPAVTRHFADVIVRRINARTGGRPNAGIE